MFFSFTIHIISFVFYSMHFTYILFQFVKGSGLRHKMWQRIRSKSGSLAYELLYYFTTQVSSGWGIDILKVVYPGCCDWVEKMVSTLRLLQIQDSGSGIRSRRRSRILVLATRKLLINLGETAKQKLFLLKVKKCQYCIILFA